MFNFIKNHQMNIMLALCSVCVAMTVMLLLTKFLSKKRKWILIGMEVTATFLLFFDRMAYIYAGNSSTTAYIMVRVSNFIVFFMTNAIVFCFNFYLIDLLTNEGKLSKIPRRLIFTGFVSAIGMLFVIIAAFNRGYYYFDSENSYHRGRYFLESYIIPIVCPLIQFTAIVKFRKCFSKFIQTALYLYIFLPIITGIIQIFAYGISIINMTMVLVSVSLYFFTYLDINAAVEKAHKIEIQSFKEKQKSIKTFFNEASAAFADVMEKGNGIKKGKSERTARIARQIAEKAGKDEDFCDQAYYSAYLCDAGAETLSYIKEYPYLSEAALYVGKPYDKKLPEYSRIITIAKDYEKMLNDPSIPAFYIRDYFIRHAGEKYDPYYSKIAVQILDFETNRGSFKESENQMETELICNDYRQNITAGIEISQFITEITFDSSSYDLAETSDSDDRQRNFSLPSIILFDSSDKRVQKTQELIDAHKYIEYGEIWFDSHFISTGARNVEIRNISKPENSKENSADKVQSYKIAACRFEDHILLKMQSPESSFEIILALPSASKSAYIGITGEHIHITNIHITQTSEKIQESELPRIAEKLNFIERIESDIPNVQITKPLENFTKEIELKENTKIYFHAQSLPDANLVWHCPYIILFSAKDKKMHGNNYHEYAMIKFDGEENGSNEYADNSFVMKKTESFTTWETWEEQNKAGYECMIECFKSGNEITLKTHNKGIFIQNTTIIKDGAKEVFAVLSGDQVALTDIRIR